MALSISNMQCCGIKELAGLSTCNSATDAMRQFGKLTHGRTYQDTAGIIRAAPFVQFRYVVFTQARSGYGQDFAQLITKAKLGELIETSSNVNPNSSNYVKVWVWTVDHVALKGYLDNLALNATGRNIT